MINVITFLNILKISLYSVSLLLMSLVCVCICCLPNLYNLTMKVMTLLLMNCAGYTGYVLDIKNNEVTVKLDSLQTPMTFNKSFLTTLLP